MSDSKLLIKIYAGDQKPGRLRTYFWPLHLQLHSLASRSRDAPFGLPAGRKPSQYVSRITVHIESNAWNELLVWRDLLRAFDPDELVVITPESRPNIKVPTPLVVVEDPGQDCRLGNKLTLFRFEGPESIPISNAGSVRPRRSIPRGAFALLVGPHLFMRSRRAREPYLIRLGVHRVNDGWTEYRSAREDIVAEWLRDPAILQDDQIVAVTLRREREGW